jgi:hypothetical protein
MPSVNLSARDAVRRDAPVYALAPDTTSMISRVMLA